MNLKGTPYDLIHSLLDLAPCFLEGLLIHSVCQIYVCILEVQRVALQGIKANLVKIGHIKIML